MSKTIQSWMEYARHILDEAGVEDIFIVLQTLLAHQLNTPKSWILAHPESIIPPLLQPELEKNLLQLSQGVPLAYILGYWHFYGHEFLVTPHTLIPRPETEILVESALHWLNGQPGSDDFRYIDIGTGSGCIPISILLEVPVLSAFVTDLSFTALKIAKANAKNLKIDPRLTFICANLLDFSSNSWNLVTANLPYIPTDKLKGLRVSRHEPLSALDGGIDGLVLIRQLLFQLKYGLSNPGLALLEFEIDQSGEVLGLAQNIFIDGKIDLIKDLAGINLILRIEKT